MYYREEDKKEKLTKERIQKDLSRIAWQSIPATVIIVLAMIFLLWVAMLALEHTALQIPRFVFSILAGVVFLFGIAILIQVIVMLYKIKHERFCITTDILTDKEQKKRYRSKYRPLENNYDRWLRFNYHTYQITSGEHYTWSQDFCMSPAELYSSSALGDKFVLVSFLGRKEPTMVYNTKFFDWKEEQ